MKPIFLFIFLLSVQSAIGQTKNFIDQPYVEVTGNEDSLVTPNQIFIKVILSEKDTRDRVSIEDLEKKMIDFFTNSGIDTETDLTTSDMLSNYRFYLLKKRDIIKTKEYVLKVPNAASASKIFIGLEDLGISNVQIDKLDHTNLEGIKNICRTKAIENARAKAVALTRTLGQTIGNAILISDNESPNSNQLQGRVPGLLIRGYSSINKDKYVEPKIEFEKISVSTSVSAKFILK